MLRALPAMVRTAASISAAVKSGILVVAISSNCSRLTLPTLFICGSPLPLGIPAAFFNKIEAGDLKQRAKTTAPDGIGELAIYFNSMDKFSY